MCLVFFYTFGCWRRRGQSFRTTTCCVFLYKVRVSVRHGCCHFVCRVESGCRETTENTWKANLALVGFRRPAVSLRFPQTILNIFEYLWFFFFILINWVIAGTVKTLSSLLPSPTHMYFWRFFKQQLSYLSLKY